MSKHSLAIWVPDSPSESYRRRNPHLYGGLSKAGQEAVAVSQKSPAKPRLRQKAGPKLNGLEAEFQALLRRELPSLAQAGFPPPVLRDHAKTYLLANGVRYTPDFTATLNGVETCWEVKGPHAWEDAMVKLKVAPAAFPEVRWVLAWKHEGDWARQEVLP